MIQTAYGYFAETALSTRPLLRHSAIGLLLMAAVLSIALLVGIAGPLVALALAVAIIGGTLILMDTLWGLVALVGVAFILPFASLPFHIGLKPTFLDIALGALFFVWALKLVTGQERQFITSSIGLLVGLFMLMAVFSFVYGMTHSRPTNFIVRRFAQILLGISLYFAAINTIRSQRSLEWISRCLLLAGWMAALIAIVFYSIPEAWTVGILDRLARFDYPGGYGALRWIEDDTSGTMRAIGTAIDPNVLGGMMLLTTGILGPQLFSSRPLLPRWLGFVMFATVGLALYWTFSRSALFGMMAGLAIPALLTYRRLLFMGIVLGLLLFLLPQTQEYVARLMAGLAGQDLATQMRFGEYQDALILIRRYPLFGVGFINVPDIDLYLGVSMFYLIMAENMGIVGVVIFLATMIGYFGMFLTTWQAGVSLEREALLLGFVAAVFGALVSGLADHYWFNLTYPHMTILFWLFVGLTSATILIERNELQWQEERNSR